MTHRIFIANRGEIAVRILDACDRLGFQTVLGVSTADRDSLGARRAGRVVTLGPASSTASYLNVPAVLHAAIATGCDSIHPGYGFLSERADFARLCHKEGLTFIGPSPEVLDALGDKLTARELAASLAVPISAGGSAETADEVAALAERIGLPVIVKAAYGGGGRGMKIVRKLRELKTAWEMASAEAQSAFGNGTVFLERYIENAKHVEVQVMGDRYGSFVHLGERECSVQFRHQKLIEESPCEAIDDQTRAVLHSSALKIARAVNYVGLGTVEFLVDPVARAVGFLEVNPRLQVEHPVTEATSGVDLVREQILAVLGTPLSFTQESIKLTGHAIEARITAQDSDNHLQPSPGRVTKWRPPASGALRLDSHIFEGYLFPPYYDALMGKLIAWGADRSAAIAALLSGLERFAIEGPKTSVALLKRILGTTEFAHNTVTTGWLTDYLEGEHVNGKHPTR